MTRAPLPTDAFDYAVDLMQRSILFWDTLRRRGNEWLDHQRAGAPPLLKFEHEMLLDARGFDRPANYALLRIMPRPDDAPTDARKRPFVVVDPRAGHGPGIGGFKEDSEVGNALREGHPVYFVTFFPDPVPGQRLVDVMLAEARFLETVRARHPGAPAPAVVGNCQAGWAIMGLAALRPELPGPILVAGAPLSYWAGSPELNPMRTTGGLLGGSWMAHMMGDLGAGRFDGANLVLNFETLNPGNTWWSKYANLLDKADTEPPRFLEFERWWGGYFLMNREEMAAIVDELFVGNKLARGEVASADGALRIDLRNIRSPICVLCSWGDDITPPHQALAWILDLYANDEDLVVQGQTIVYCVHPNVGHLGIFVSGSVARKEHAGFVETLDLIESLPPGLFEMVIEDKTEGMRAAGLVPDRYVTRFERRSVADVAALVGDRAGERPYEVVRRVSEINAGLYNEFMRPAVQAMAKEQAAGVARLFHPLRAQRWMISDLNPFLWPLASMAEAARAERRPAEDNPWRLWEREGAKAVERGFEAMSSFRNRLSQQVFDAVYTSPALRAAVGLADAPPPQPLGADPLRVALAHREAEKLLAEADRGTPLEGIVRLLVALFGARGAIDERAWRALRAAAADLPPEMHLTPEALREVARREARLLQLDRAAALRGLARILGTPEDRALAEGLLRRAAREAGVEAPSDLEGAIRAELGVEAPLGEVAAPPRRPRRTATRARA